MDGISNKQFWMTFTPAPLANLLHSHLFILFFWLFLLSRSEHSRWDCSRHRQETASHTMYWAGGYYLLLKASLTLALLCVCMYTCVCLWRDYIFVDLITFSLFNILQSRMTPCVRVHLCFSLSWPTVESLTLRSMSNTRGKRHRTCTTVKMIWTIGSVTYNANTKICILIIK